MAAPSFNGIAAGAAAVLSAAAVTVDGRAMVVYDHEPREVDSLPAAWVRGPVEWTRRDPDDIERELGREDWDLVYEVFVMVPMDRPEQGQDNANNVMQDVLYAFDGDPTLGALAGVTEAVLSDGERSYLDVDDSNRQAVLWTCRLAVMTQSTQ